MEKFEALISSEKTNPSSSQVKMDFIPKIFKKRQTFLITLWSKLLNTISEPPFQKLEHVIRLLN